MIVISALSIGDPGGTRTPYLQIRNLSLYPDELRDHTGVFMTHFNGDCQMPRRRGGLSSARSHREGNRHRYEAHGERGRG